MGMRWKKKCFAGIAACIVWAWIGIQPGYCLEEEFVNSVGIKFVLIPAGSFMMGCKEETELCASNEVPRHKVTISKPFYMGVYQVTQENWEAVMENNPSRHKGAKNPVDSVSWEDVQDFIRKLNREEETTIYRLPTEAEWEYAARAGSETIYYFGDDAKDLPEHAWYGDLPGMTGTLPVGQKKPNAWGLYDIYGNVDEWTEDWLGDTYYAESPEVDPPGASSGVYRVLRGGSWPSTAWFCRSAARNVLKPDLRLHFFGFRLAADAVEAE
ncbi:formylglycine-generating enzyme family protein [Desulfococcaceae bacterium OttesenSCG-928-F15]|nr:formylglycine-generating enzyme family protein [Desulfococcaceae bacterium OttesenSCG-928-F15]